MTHPFHPLRWKGFFLLEHRRSGGGDQVCFEDDSGKVRCIPRSWTTLCTPDPFVSIAAGRSPFRLEDLLSLSQLLGDVRPPEARGARKARGRECKGDSAACVKANMPNTEGGLHGSGGISNRNRRSGNVLPTERS